MPSAQSSATATAVRSDDLFIPLIDFGEFLHGTLNARKASAKAILKGFQNSGFIYLRNHGIPADTSARIFTESAKFFKRPQWQKDKLAWLSAAGNRGYTGMGREKTTSLTNADEIKALREAAPDLKESLEIGRPDEPDYPNRLPDEFDEEGRTFSEIMLEFHARLKILHLEVLAAIATGLGIEERWFDAFCDGGDNTLRLLHYPSTPKSVFKSNPNQVRASPHSDYGSITLLFQDSRGGLQVQSPHGNFVDATPIPGTIVVNAGDLLARWSNSTIKSTIHQVVEPPAPEEGDEHPARYSIAYFCNPNFDKTIEAIPGTYAAEADIKYPPVQSGEYLIRRLTETY